MTNQEFNASYQLLKQVTDGEVRTFHALAATGAVVMVHLLRADDAATASELLALADSLPPSQRERVLSITDVEGAPLIVTRFLLEFSTLRDWLVKSVSGAGREAGSAGPAAYQRAPAMQQPMDRGAPSAGQVGGPHQPAAPPDRAAEPAAQPADAPSGEPAREPGEFTRMFGAVRPPAEPAHGASPPAAAPPPAAPTSAQPAMDVPRQSADIEAGGGARDASPAAPRDPSPAARDSAPSAPASPPAAPEPGEFTRMFRAADIAPAAEQPGREVPAPGQPSPGQPSPGQPSPGEPSPGQPPDVPVPGQPRPDPTRPPSQPRPEPPRHPDPSQPPTRPQPEPQRHPDPTHPPTPPAEPVRPGAPDLAARAAGPPKSGPGEFTQMFGAAARPADLPPPAPAPPSAGGADTAGRSDQEASPRDPSSDGSSSAGEEPAAPPIASPGEFTSIFGAPQMPSQPAADARAHGTPIPQPPSSSPPSGPAPQREPSEFTRLFGTPSPPSAALPPATQSQGGHWAPGGGSWSASQTPSSAGSNDDYLARLGGSGGFSAPPQQPNRADIPAPQPASPRPAAGGWNLDLPRPPAPPPGPGEYTRIIATPSPSVGGPATPQMPQMPPAAAAPQAAAAYAQAAAPAQAAKPPSRIWLIVGLAAVLVLTIVIVLVLLLASRPTTVPPAETPPATSPAGATGNAPAVRTG